MAGCSSTRRRVIRLDAVDLTPIEVSTMQRIEFTMEEIELLREILQHKIDEVDVEMFRTDTHDFKQMLKHRRQLLERLRTRFSSVPVPV
jgi:phenylalanine-4-hydroxylase